MEFIIFFLINIIKIFKYAILVRVLMSWIQTNPNGAIVRFIHEVTEPILKICRRILPRTGMIDLSPLLAFFALDFIQIGIIKLLSNL